MTRDVIFLILVLLVHLLKGKPMDTKNNEVVRDEVAKLLLEFCKVANNYFAKVTSYAKSNPINNNSVRTTDVLSAVSTMNHEITKLTDFVSTINWEYVTFRQLSVTVARATITNRAVREVELIWNAKTVITSYAFVRNAIDKMLLVMEIEASKNTNGGE